MARKKKSSISPLLVAVLVAVTAGVVVLLMVFIGEGTEPHRTTDTLDGRLYLENSNSLRGNVYRMNAEVVNSLAMSRTRGRMFSVLSGDERLMAVIVPPEFNNVNIQRGQNFILLVEVDEQGLLRVKDLTKS